MSTLNKKTLEYLAGLGRIEIKEKDEEKLLKDLKEILGYFEQLKEVDTENVEPLAGGTIEKNVFREDEVKSYQKNQKLIKQFPEEGKGYLKVPPVFE